MRCHSADREPLNARAAGTGHPVHAIPGQLRHCSVNDYISFLFNSSSLPDARPPSK